MKNYAVILFVIFVALVLSGCGEEVSQQSEESRSSSLQSHSVAQDMEAEGPETELEDVVEDDLSVPSNHTETMPTETSKEESTGWI